MRKESVVMLRWLQKWYEYNCDGSWEHMFGVKVDTLDNPGWVVKIDLEETVLENKPFEEIQYDNGDEDWISCRVKGTVFDGAGDPKKLETILEIFKKWAETECMIE